MAGQLIQHRVYIGGIEVPCLSVAVSSAPNTVWQGTLTMPWSPFLMKLPKGTKITVFRKNSDVFKEFRLLFDGCLTGISETKAWKGQASIQLNVNSDGIVFYWRKMGITELEMSLSGKSIALKEDSGADSQATLTSLNNIFQMGPGMFVPEDEVKSDACKAAAFWLSGIPTDAKPSGRMYHDNGEIRTIAGPKGKGSAVDYAHLSPFLQKYYKNYHLQEKITYVPLPDALKASFAGKQAWDMMAQRINNPAGMTTYWEIASYITSFFQGTILSIPDATLSTKGLSEILVMPHNFFGKAAFCNIIFPDQVMAKSQSVNFGAEVSRAFISGDAIPIAVETAFDGLHQWRYKGPYDLTGTMKDLNLTKSTEAGPRSEYEEQYGVNLYQAPLDEHLVRVLLGATALDKKENNKQKDVQVTKALTETLNHEFLIGYCQKFGMTIQVQPDVEVVPGTAIIILDEDGEHTVAYCAGVSYVWNAQGQASTQVNLVYPHHYSLDLTNATHLGNPLSAVSGNEEAVAAYEEMIGSVISRSLSNKELADKYFKMWQEEYNRFSPYEVR